MPALQVSRRIFFPTFAAMRLVRFSAGAALARVYGRGIGQAVESETFQLVVIGFLALAVTGTTVSAVLLWRGTRARPVTA